MGATSDNYEIVTSGTTYTIASTFVNDAHHQRVQILYGQTGAVSEVTSASGLPVNIVGADYGTFNVNLSNFSYANPVPVSISGATGISLSFASGTTLNVTIDGAFDRYDYLSNSGYYSLATTIVGFGNSGDYIPIVGVEGGTLIGVTVGTVGITVSSLDIRKLYGGVVGDTSGTTTDIDYVVVQGICGAYPVGITTSSSIPVSIASFVDIGVFGVSGATALGVTFGTVNIRGLTANTDTITVYGGGTASTVSVGLFGFSGATATELYSENNALNVNIKSSEGITVSGASFGIRNLSYSSDTITVVGQGAADTMTLSTVPTYMNTVMKNGTLTRVGGETGSGWSGSAMNVYLVNSGFSFNATATFSTGIGISQEAYNPVPIHGSTSAVNAVWVSGDTANGPVSVKGYCGGNLPVYISQFDTNLSTVSGTINGTLGGVKINTDFLAAMKKALYSSNVSIGATDFNDSQSIYTLVQGAVNNNLTPVSQTILPNSVASSINNATQKSMAVSVVSYRQQSSFLSRTGCATNTPQNLTAFSAATGYTCANGVRIKTSRIATGANASQNEVMCVISEADAAVYGASAGTASYVLYHGDEMFFEVDNINKIKVFYPPYSTGFAPHNTGSGITFSFYAS